MKTKAIKTLALLIVLTLTMSVMGVSAMTASHNVVMNANDADVSNYTLNSKYTLAEFESDLENSEYVAFFNFDSEENGVNMDAAITNSDQTSGIETIVNGTFSRVPIAPGTAERNHNWASGNSAGLISANGKIEFKIPVKNGLKPVAVGFFMTTHKTGAFPLVQAPEVTYNVGSEKATPTSLAVGQDLAFCGFKAEGRYITSVTVFSNATNSMRLDDFCVIYTKDDIYGINTNNGVTAASPTAYDEDMFYKDFNKAQYSVLYDFDATKTDTSYTVSGGYNLILSAPITGTDTQKCAITSNKFKK